MPAMTKDEREALENLVDRHSLRWVLVALSEIAAEKEQHVRENWQDRDLAKRWGRASNRLDTEAHRANVDAI